ncbi:adenosylmethionine--8-amino-7-oxononanoate transaminase [Nocardioides sp.]|uniref:adenosylmethionine--8-amino-7-oxononanoate transaminase n=1 Tax=Nocardioides sp. TaxID=35761 RepID=UPI003D0EEE37
MTPLQSAELLAFDRQHLWHPYTSMTEPTPTRLVTGADGVRLTLADGRVVIDAMSSWWSAIHGYRHPALTAAATAQLDSMAHVMFGGLTHEPAIRLARQLIEITPGGLEHVFLADSGSVSVEVAMKMALQHQRGVGHPERTRFLTVRGGYHGDTFDAMSVCDPVGGMHSMFTGLLPEQLFGDRPPGQGQDISEWEAGFRALAARHASEIAGLIVEPLLQGAGGMHPYPAACLTVFRDVADEHDLVLIFDEIATGFGRTGTLFAAEAAGVAPDVMCVGKALTGGYLSLAAVLCTTAIARGLSQSDAGVLMHGPTFMGNPLACAIASASIDLLLGQDWEGEIQRINAGLARGLGEGLAGGAVARTLGAVGVIQLDHQVDVAKATEVALEHGVWLRPFRDLIYTMPPYVCTDDEIAAITTAMRAAADVA